MTTPVLIAERTYRNWSTPILLELNLRAHQLDAPSRQALRNVLIERRMADLGKPTEVEQRKTA
ncbi:hypothetical protein NLK61_28230 [Pseudomonas fuscovaginae UPB0736]|uniref:Uncharacterized protein n=1 Tax=Pseudomonas asplenii TaxID=53407 RepID=A0A1H1YMF1_9PSED|nr:MULTISPECIES: hypothetical protein [Pseudomonas]UUQ65028.1 hypothetical protein NLK61_28230 [Pseudomonas fuscovaginae UPB0736]UZE31738.1 hypothetical protein LOY63_13780 [Pseudomonas asplenii]SDT22459.1 hypothetical protein SAMN05216598_4510 [Pseudomonas asplenii]SEI19656.1 hypothetical protein SAMN05216581_4019 [Pseudomonas fuscovaginae]